MSEIRVVKSVCGLCYAGCAVLVHVTDGKVTKVEGDTEGVLNRGAMCVKGLASLEYLYHPDRLKHPLRRVGERGEGNWQRISWDEALNSVAEGLSRAKDKGGARSVAIMDGVAKGLLSNYLERFAYAFGTPNHSTTGYVCFAPRVFSSIVTCGFLPSPDYDYPPACIMVWGANTADTRIGEYLETVKALDRGTRLVVIDSREIKLAGRADLWIKVRPGSDLALALGMINVIINEGLIDKAFVDDWTVGFDQLKAHVQDYSPERVEEITWVPADKVREVARFYALNKPACIQWGNALEHNVNGFQAARAILILEAITGNIGVPGGDLQFSSTGLRNWGSPEFSLRDLITAEKYEERIGAHLNLIPLFRRATPPMIAKAILEGDPYPVHNVYIQGYNPLVTSGNARKMYQALKKVDFLAVSEIFMTPTAMLADILLPAATYLEFDNIRINYDHAVVQAQQKVVEVGECWSDFKILNELARKLGLGDYFWGNEEQFLDYMLQPAGLTFEEFRKVRVISGVKQYRSYEVDGWETPSRKVEIHSSKLKEWGIDPLPVYREPMETPYSTPELAREYPLIFTTWKMSRFHHSTGKQIPALRSGHPDPVVEIHPETAGELGIKDGDWVYIETKRGRIKQKAALSRGIDPRVVIPDYGWWFPEKGVSESYGWEESNINILTDDKPPYGRETGSTTLRGILCKVYKVDK
ncbi:molybdopterin-dependent oxidoreductase [Chloroflexota bacterium]